MDPSLDTVELRTLDCNLEGQTATLVTGPESFSHTDTESSIITLHEANPSGTWDLPSILPFEVYKLKWYKYFSTTQIKISSTNVAFTGQDDPIHINLLSKEQIAWEKSKGYKYAHLGAVKFRLGPLVRPFLPVLSMCSIVDTRPKEFQDALIGGILAPLHFGPAFATVFPKYFVSLYEPHINNLFKAYISPRGFNMDAGSLIIQLKAAVCVRFGNDTLLAMQPSIHQSSDLRSVVESHNSRHTTPLTFNWTGIQYPVEWDVKYKELCSKDWSLADIFPYSAPVSFDSQSNSFRILDQHPTPRFTPMESTSSGSTVQQPSPALPRSTSVSGSIPSTSIELRHKGKHEKCEACKLVLIKLKGKAINLFMFSFLPRSHSQKEEINPAGKKSFLPGRNLPSESFQQYNTEGTVKREYLFHKSTASNDDSSVSEGEKLGNYYNMQLKCLGNNLDDMARDILLLRNRMESEKEDLAKLDSKLDMVMHVLSDTSAIKE